ncbi:MAG: sulfurtransferase [Gammaproteobacteria bacterium]|nr:MAG: sulfurtransferase [Gammaproteobacteria bacterium]
MARALILWLFLWIPPVLAERPAFLVDADWLEAHLDDPKLVILEVRYHPHRYFTVGHIPGAVQVQRFKDLGDNFAVPLMRFPSREAFQATLRRWGVDDDSLIVIYDDSRTALASRLYFLLDLYGYDMERVKVLEGGTIEWTAFHELSREPVHPRPGSVTLKPARRDLYVEWTQIYDDVVSRRDPGIVLIDARPRDMYTGKVIRHAIRGGHIPGAINISSLQGTDGESQRWLSQERLAELYAQVPKDKTLYVYCHDGFRMSLAYMQLKSLGYRDVRLYNGGWSHWGNALTLPVVEGDAPYDEAFKL